MRAPEEKAQADARPPTAADSDLDAVLGQAPLHPGDHVPEPVLRTYQWLQTHWSAGGRYRAGLAIGMVAFAAASTIAAARLLHLILGIFDPAAYLGLFIVTWLGFGGVLVPIPGMRILSLIMLAQQSASLSPLEAAVVATIAMTVGQTSYYVAGAESALRYASGERGADASDVEGITAVLSPDEPGHDENQSNTGTHAPGTLAGLRARMTASLQSAQTRVRPTLERRGIVGVFALSSVPSPAATAAAFVGGALGFGFGRFLLASTAGHALLALVVVLVGALLGQAVT